jgi:hypothetical protein
MKGTKLDSVYKCYEIGGGKFVEWIHLAHGRGKWWAFLNAVMNFGGSISRLSEKLLAFEEGFCFRELVSWLVGWLVGWLVSSLVN